MNINATLFVQAIHFFIAYLLFRLILLKPAYALIRQEEHDQKSLEERIVSDKQELIRIHKERIAQWRSCRQACEPHVPQMSIRAEMFRGIVPTFAVPLASKQERHAMMEALSRTIISRMEKT